MFSLYRILHNHKLLMIWPASSYLPVTSICYSTWKVPPQTLNDMTKVKNLPVQDSFYLLGENKQFNTIGFSNPHQFSTCAKFAASEIQSKYVNNQHTEVLDKASHPTLSTFIDDNEAVSKYTEVVPGKGRPPEPPMECCMSGCANCVWISYAEELREYYQDGNERAREEIEKIENPSLKAFIKLELGLM